jgi:hypothetical protein
LSSFFVREGVFLMGWNPANWQIVNAMQGQRGGDITPGFSLGVSKAVRSVTPAGFGLQNGNVVTVPQVNSGTATKNNPTNTSSGQVNGFTTTEPNNLNITGAGTSNSSGGYSNGYTSEDVNNINSQLSRTDALLNSLGVTRGVGLQNIENEYGKNVGRARAGQDQFNRDLNIRRDDNSRNKENSLNRINTDAENKYNSVMRVLGIRRAGMSSTSQVLVPHLIAQLAGNQRADQFDTYGRNDRGITIAQQDSDLKYKNLFDDLLGQRDTKRNDFEQSIINQQNDIYGTQANLRAQLDAAKGGTGKMAYQEYNDRLGRNQVTLDDLIRASQTPAYNYQAVDTTAPNLDQYTADPLAVEAQGVDDPTASEVNAYLPWLQRKQKLGLY